MMPEPPKLSVVVASIGRAEELSRMLETLIEQSKSGPVEIIAATAGPADLFRSVEARFPEVVFLSLPGDATLPALLGAGVARSRGEIIAITESWCELDSHWVAAILKAHESPAPVIGGAVEMKAGGTLIDWAAYFCDYGQFMRPLPAGVAQELPGNNLAFKRALLDQGQEYSRGSFWKTYWCRHLQRQGITLSVAPEMLIYYAKSYLLGPYLKRRFHHGRCFAGMRQAGLSAGRRAAFAAGSVLLPLILLKRMLGTVFPKRRHRKKLILSFPVVLLALTSWSAGELVGYVLGPGESCTHVR